MSQQDFDEVDYEMLSAKVDAMGKRIRRLERVVGIEGKTGVAAENSPLDHRDRTVLAVLEEANPDEVTAGNIHALYRNHTNIRRKRTLRERTGTLTKHGPFEQVRPGRWEYDP